MKKILFTMMAVSLLFSATGKKKIDFEKEKTAIIATIEQEKKGYAEKNMEWMKMNVVDDASYTWIYSSANGNMINHGFSNQEKLVKSWWNDSDSEFPKQKISTDFIELKIYSEAAWAVINVVWEEIKDGQTNKKRVGIETLFFEKENGKWKIACHNVLDKSSYEE